MARMQERAAQEEYHYQELNREENIKSLHTQSPGKTKSETENIENVSELSHWGIGLKVLLALAVPYTFGVIIAVAHFLMFHYLDQKRIGKDTSFPQSWVSSVSLFLLFIFRLCVCFSLGVAFTQHLWRIIRLAPVKVSDLDRYHSIQTNILALLHPQTISGAPILFLMAGTGFLVAFAVLFPAGALTVENKRFEEFHDQTVSIYNSSYMANGSIEDALDQSLSRTNTLRMQYKSVKPIAVTTAKATLITGLLPNLQSSCGPNCTYTLVFDGPHAKCSSSTYNESATTAPGYLPAWNSSWIEPVSQFSLTVPRDDVECPPGVSGTNCSISSFPEGFFFDKFSNIQSTITGDGTNVQYNRTTERMFCTPGVGKYTAKVIYDNGLQNIDMKSEFIESFADFWAKAGVVSSPNGLVDAQLFVSAINLMAVFDSLVTLFGGTFRDTLEVTYIGPFLTTIYSPDYEVNDILPDADQTIIRDTVFNNARFDWSRREYWTSNDVNITEFGINQALQNITIAMMQINPAWKTTTRVTQISYDNILSFSSRPRLIIPYACSLGAVLPFLILGYISMRRNGVPAISGGFVQTLMTTTGSATLRDAAAVGCLGGDQNTPQRLKDMKIVYGELVEDKQGIEVRRATFGVKEEIVPLRKGGLYGK